jgi:RNA polymerase sigma-70 factor (ECF subfamily)
MDHDEKRLIPRWLDAEERGSGERERPNLGLHFSKTYRKEREFVVSTVRRLGVPQADVEDAVQDVFIILHSRFDELERGAGLRLWLAAVAVRICSNRRRSLLRRNAGGRFDSDFAIEELVDQRQGLPDELSADNERRRLLWSALARLDPKKREVFVLAELEQRTANEIASLTNVSRNTVASRLRAARRRVAHSLRGANSPAEPKSTRASEPISGLAR